MQTLKTDTRKRILNVSKKLFLKKGFRETTTREIAREAGINLSNLYHYFASNDELFCQLLKPATNTLEAMLNEHHGIKGVDFLSMQEKGYKEYYVEKATRLVLDWLRAMKTKHPEINTDVSDFFVHLNNVWMFTLLEEILMHDLPEEDYCVLKFTATDGRFYSDFYPRSFVL